jgi:hypothetical protein
MRSDFLDRLLEGYALSGDLGLELLTGTGTAADAAAVS